MKIHPAGYTTIFISTLILVGLNVGFYFFKNTSLSEILLLISLLIYLLLLWFFRYPNRSVVLDRNAIIAPCDGKIIDVKEIEEKDFMQGKSLQISIFMSPLNVHINWYPVTGIVKYSKHIKGKFIAAFKDKSSHLNEKHLTLIYTLDGVPILMKQIAGAMARKISNNAIIGRTVLQSKEAGFIKFGSRIDVIFPAYCKILVYEGQHIKGAQTKLALIPKK